MEIKINADRSSHELSLHKLGKGQAGFEPEQGTVYFRDNFGESFKLSEEGVLVLTGKIVTYMNHPLVPVESIEINVTTQVG